MHFRFRASYIPLKCLELYLVRNMNFKYLEIFKILCWRKMEEVSWTDRMRNKVLQRAIDEKNIVQQIKRRKTKWISHIWRRN